MRQFGRLIAEKCEHRCFASLEIEMLPDGIQVVVTQQFEEVMMGKSSNASASAFGWDFQSNAAIMLMLKNIGNASKVKVEGINEDIEITLANGKILMSQAKAVFNPDDFSHVKEKLEAGLRTLDAAAKLSNVEQLIYITNSPNPFNDVSTMYKFSSPLNTVPFSELPTTCQQAVSGICAAKGYGFDTALLKVCVMQFHGESEDERYKVLSSLISEFLNNIGVRAISTEQLLSLWQRTFTINASQMTTSITKERMVWPIIAILCDATKNDTAFADYDESDVEELLQKFRSIINSNSESFEFISRVLSDYNDFHPEMKSKERTELFISDKWKNYGDFFDFRNVSQNTEKIVIGLTISNILRNRNVITDIKGKVGL